MKKSILAFFMCIIILVFNLCSCGSLVKNPSYNPEECTTLHLSPTVCEAAFNKTTPKEFCKNKGKGTYIYKNYISAKVDDDGCLILIVKNDVISAWKNSLYPMQVLQCVLGDSRDIGVVVDYSKESELSGFMNFSFMKDAGDCGLEISDDFTKVIARPGSDKTYLIRPTSYSEIRRQLHLRAKRGRRIFRAWRLTATVIFTAMTKQAAKYLCMTANAI